MAITKAIAADYPPDRRLPREHRHPARNGYNARDTVVFVKSGKSLCSNR